MKAPSKTQSVRFVTRFLAATTVLVSCASAYAAEAPARTEEQNTLYAIGLSISRSLSVFDLSPTDFEFVKQGLIDAQAGKKSAVDPATYNAKIQEFAKNRRKALGEKQVGAGKAFLEQAAKEKGAVKTASGMVYRSLAEGKGASPKASDLVKVKGGSRLEPPIQLLPVISVCYIALRNRAR